MNRVCLLAGIAFRVAGWAVALSLPAVAGDSPFATAPLRLRIELFQNSDWPADVGTVAIPPGLDIPGRLGVFTAAGKPVAFETYWSASGEPTAIQFDTSSGGKTYYLCFGPNLPSAPGGWKPEAGVLVETRPCTEQPMDNFAQISRLLNFAGPPQGRGYVPAIFLGMNPFGPSSHYIMSFSAWFNAPKDGRYRFATVSTDASWLQVDGKNVAEWLGEHEAHRGRRGQHSGEIQLNAGRHHLTYTQIQFDGPATAEAAWQPPGADDFKVMPAAAFVPVARFRVVNVESASPAAPLYFECRTIGQCALGETMAVRVRFHVLNDYKGRSYHWRFDDGTEAAGGKLEHMFPQPGLRQVTLEAWEHGLCVATNSVRLRIQPEWLQRDSWRDDIFADAKDDFLHRDLNRTPAGDLTAMITLADRADDRELLTHAGGVMVERANEFTAPADGLWFYKLGVAFQHQGDAGDAQAEKSFRLALAPERNLASMADKVKLRLAGLLIDGYGRLDEAAKLLGEIRGGNLTGDERRLQQLFAGDLLLARGKIKEARQQYLSVGQRSSDGRFAAARAARIESANILIEHDQFDDARQALDQLTFDFPLERMSPGAGLLEIELSLEQKEYQRAFAGCQRLLPCVANDPRESQLLYCTVEAGRATGKTDAARAALTRLLKEFPFSESAAKAKDRWPAN